MKRLLFDARWKGAHGIGLFARHVANGLSAQLSELDLSGKPSSVLDPLKLSIRLAACPARAVFFSPGYNAPLLCRQRYVLTLHDLIHTEEIPGRSAAKRAYMNVVTKRFCRKAALVFTVSDYSRTRIIEWGELNPTRVVNVGNGVADSFRPDAAPLDLGYSYFLCVSNRRPHKNEERIVRAFAEAGLGPSVKLVFTGNATSELLPIVKAVDAADRIEFTGFIDDSSMPGLYRGSIGLVFPSLSEGFGLPILEAMACGAPVITSNISAMPEVAGDAAVLVNPYSVEEIAAALLAIADSPDLRESLATRGLRRASSYSWSLTTNKIRDALREHALE